MHVTHSPSDGAGRSGVYIAIDANIELCEEDGVFDVYGYLKKMRGLRRGLVETLVSHLLLVTASTKFHEEFTIAEKAPTRAFSWLKQLNRG